MGSWLKSRKLWIAVVTGALAAGARALGLEPVAEVVLYVGAALGAGHVLTDCAHLIGSKK